MPTIPYDYPTSCEELTEETKDEVSQYRGPLVASLTKNYRDLSSPTGQQVWQDELEQFRQNLEFGESDWGVYLESHRWR